MKLELGLNGQPTKLTDIGKEIKTMIPLLRDEGCISHGDKTDIEFLVNMDNITLIDKEVNEKGTIFSVAYSNNKECIVIQFPKKKGDKLIIMRARFKR